MLKKPLARLYDGRRGSRVGCSALGKYFHPPKDAIDPLGNLAQFLNEGIYAWCDDQTSQINCDNLIQNLDRFEEELAAAVGWPN